MIVAYIRVSTEEQSANFSLDAQALAISNYAKLHSFKIDEIIRDVGSGKNLDKRPGLRALRARSSDTIIISAISRLGRNTLIALELFEKHKIISVSEGDFIGASGKLFFTLLSAVAEFELDLIHSRAAQSIKIKNDNYLEYIKKYFDIFVGNRSLRDIANDLERNLVKSPRGLSKWQPMQVKRIKEKYLL